MSSRIVAAESAAAGGSDYAVGLVEATLQADDLGYEISGKTILSGISATFEPRKVTAIMGSSGAGKTTLLNVLAARAPGFRTGTIMINGAPTTLSKMRLLLSYMPQDDILYTQLTVEQLLAYSSQLLCPGSWSPSAKDARAREIMARLDLTKVAGNLVSGVSGGQRKRVSAAVEFMSGRPLLFMDEPTSGLDSAISKSLVDSLRLAAHEEARTVVATIHQPSWSLLGKFDKLLVLAPREGNSGGTVIFDGAPGDLPGHFAAAGSPTPADANPADHMLHVLTNEGGDKWADIWRGTEAASEVAARFKQISAKQADMVYDSDAENDDVAYPVTFFAMYRTLFMRALHIWLVDSQQWPLIFKMQAALFTLLALMMVDMPFNLSKACMTFFAFTTQFQTLMTPLTVIMPEERAVSLREYRNGVFSAPAYFLARVTLALISAAALATMTTVCFYPIVGYPITPFPSKMLTWWIFQFLYVSTILCLGYVVGMFAPTAIAANKMVVAITMPWLITAGVIPPVAMIRPTTYPLHYPNLFTWSAKIGMVITFTGNGDKANDTLRNTLKYHPGNLDSCFYALGVCFLVVLGLGALVTSRVLARADKSAGERAPKAKSIQSPEPGSPDSPEVTVAVAVAEKKIDDPSRPKDELGLLNPLLGPSTEAAYGATDIEAPVVMRSVPIEVRNVSYRHLRRPDKVVITDCSVRFDAGTVTILMGPSGAGKTTLLSLLCGRLPTGEVTLSDGTRTQCLEGDVLVDGAPATIAAFKKIGTLTPQDEHLPEVLTVRQTLMYTAELRSPRTWSHAVKVARVQQIMDKFNLAHKADNVIGNPLKVGISGGQKKRLSIAMDLLAELPIMLLDEPTTGLDAAAALNVVDTLLSLAQDQDRTVIVTLHQPPWSTVVTFDQLVLLAAGHVVFDANAAGLPAFLKEGGAPSPPNENPVDHVMEILVGVDLEPWVELRASKKEKLSGGKQVERRPSLTDADRAELLKEEYPVSFWTQVWVLTRRCGYIFVVDEDQFPEVLIPSIITAVLIGLNYRNWGLNFYFGAALLFIISAHAMIIISGLALNIPTERLLILREYQNGSFCVLAYWTARTLVSLWAATVISFPMYAIYYPLVGLQCEFWPIFHLWYSSLLDACVFAIIAGVIGLSCESAIVTAQVAEPVATLTILFSGAIVTKRFIKDYALPIYYSLPIGYAFENAMTALLEHKGEDGEVLLQYFDLHASNRFRNYVIMHVMLVAWIVIGYYIALDKLAPKDT